MIRSIKKSIKLNKISNCFLSAGGVKEILYFGYERFGNDLLELILFDRPID
jgi:hypothetical protein